MFKLTICHVIVFLLDIFAGLHQFCHLVAVEDLLFVFGTGGLLALVPHLAFGLLFLHFAGPFPVIYDNLFAELLLLAEMLQDVGAILDGVEVLEKRVVLRKLAALGITGIHLLFHT